MRVCILICSSFITDFRYSYYLVQSSFWIFRSVIFMLVSFFRFRSMCIFSD